MTKYATYLVTASPYKDDISGSVEGVVFEWWIHNIVYSFAKEYGLTEWVEKAQDVDIGKTIYDDNHIIFSAIMWALYEMAWPKQSAGDKAIHEMQERR